VIDIEEDVLAPKALGDLLAGDQLPATLDQQDEQLHGELFQAKEAFTPLEAIPGLIECELAEMEFWSRKSPTYS
jgi:hypothetical protein